VLIEAVASSPVPVVADLGHASDDLVLGRVANASFPTPTAFGAWLRTCVDKKRARARRLKEAEVRERTEGLLRQLEALQAAADRLAWWRAEALALGGLLTAVLLWQFLGR
jgi:exonuclease VII large subunit